MTVLFSLQIPRPSMISRIIFLNNYILKSLAKRITFLCWSFNYQSNGDISLTQPHITKKSITSSNFKIPIPDQHHFHTSPTTMKKLNTHHSPIHPSSCTPVLSEIFATWRMGQDDTKHSLLKNYPDTTLQLHLVI